MFEYKIKKELNSGLCSTAYILDDKYIQLVGKRNDSYDIYKDMKANADLLEGNITCVDYPNSMILIEKCKDYPYGSLIYPMVKGKPLNVNNISKEQLDIIAVDLVKFNKQMHNSNIHWDREKSINHELEKVNNNIELLKKYLNKQEIKKLKEYEKQFSFYLHSKQNFCITHGDLWADNLIVDENNKLSGVIDFGNMAYFLPEVDYASLWDMTDDFLKKMIEVSNEDVTKESINLFIIHRELCSFEYILNDDIENKKSQIEKIKEVLKLIK